MLEPWDRIVEWLRQHCPADAADVRAPAAEADLEAAESAVGVPLPVDLAAWWRTADGVGPRFHLLPGFAPYSVRDALASRRTWLEVSEPSGDTEPAGSACHGVWLPQWLPVAGNGSGDDLFVDLRPGPAFGCVGRFDHEIWEYDGPRWPGITAVLTEVGEALATGRAINHQQPRIVDGRLSWEHVWVRPRIGPSGEIAVGDVTPDEAGIRPAVLVDGAEGEQLPVYVPRDVDALLRERLAEAARAGGSVVLVGEPLTGKSRTMHEAVTAVLPDWELILISDAQRLAGVARAGHRRRILWLDDMRADKFSASLLVYSLRQLRRPGAVVAGTCQADQWALIMPPDQVDHALVPSRPNVLRSPEQIRAGEVTELAALTTVLRLPAELSPDERAAAVTAGRADRRIAVALTDPGGLVPALGGGPALVRRWEEAEDEYDWALATAAADARRAGCRTLGRELLTAAAGAYLGSATPVPSWSGEYVMGDYLYDHIRRARATTPLPERAWRALIDHHVPGDTFLLAEGAIAEGRPDHAEALCRRILDTVEDLEEPYRLARRTMAVTALVQLLAGAGRVGDALAVVERHPGSARAEAVQTLDELLARHDRTDDLRRRAEGGDPYAGMFLSRLLARTGDLAQLRERAERDDPAALAALIQHLHEQDRADEVVTLLEELAAGGNEMAAALLNTGHE
ncbi:SMI1/KNR4 family protein [Actinoplanes sp. NPDC000266]